MTWTNMKCVIEKLYKKVVICQELHQEPFSHVQGQINKIQLLDPFFIFLFSSFGGR